VRGLTDDQGNALVPNSAEQLVSGAAPNLTHIMSRTTFAGGSFPLKKDDCTNDPAYAASFVTGTADNCVNVPEVSRWIRNPPAMKPMYPKPTPDSNGLIRGMPNLGLSEDQIQKLVAYLTTLK
jgi:cytochrome c oxidase subunit 2